MSRKNNLYDIYREEATYHKIDEDKVRKDSSGTYRSETLQPIEGEDSIFEDVGAGIIFKYTNGEVLTKEEFHLFESWIVQSGNSVIITPNNFDYDKGQMIRIDDNDNIINKAIPKYSVSRNLRRNKKRKPEKWILFIG